MTTDANEPAGAAGGSLPKGWLAEVFERVRAEVASWSPDKRAFLEEFVPESQRRRAAVFAKCTTCGRTIYEGDLWFVDLAGKKHCEWCS